MIPIRYKYFAVDFDGTIVDKQTLTPLPNVKCVMDKIKKNNGEIAIWTCRTGDDLQEAINVLDKYNIPYDTVNETLPFYKNQWGENGRKIFVEAYIDDQSIHNRNGIDWFEIENWIFEEDETT